MFLLPELIVGATHAEYFQDVIESEIMSAMVELLHRLLQDEKQHRHRHAYSEVICVK